mmetsp:Transcript_7946/g.17237  ORF Transcript_7946/g.17237 Transcript_7946/m.17237 type:complete len:394 (-) Transcript_7946:159-1340(-)
MNHSEDRNRRSNRSDSVPAKRQRRDDDRHPRGRGCGHRYRGDEPTFYSNRRALRPFPPAFSPLHRDFGRRTEDGGEPQPRCRDARLSTSCKVPSPPVSRGGEAVVEWPLATPMSTMAERRLVTSPGFIRWRDEVGTLQSLPAFRVQEFRAACRAARFPFNAGASLRRHHVKYRLAADLRYTRGMDHHQVDRLGRQEDIKGAADAFEDVVREFLEELGLHFWDEHHQKARWQEEVKQWTQRREDMFMRSPHTKHDTDVLDRPPLCPPTPDFILPTPIYIQGRRTSIHWIEVKHFYGATTIPTDGSVRHAICSLVPKARQYLDTYGPGAYIFAYGVGEGMVHALAQLQELSNTKNHVSSQDENPVIVLDSSHMKMDRVHRQLSRWCGDRKGQILP